MIRYECDKCGRALAANDRQRYIVKMEVFAAAEHIDRPLPGPFFGLAFDYASLLGRAEDHYLASQVGA